MSKILFQKNNPKKKTSKTMMVYKTYAHKFKSFFPAPPDPTASAWVVPPEYDH